MSKIYTRNTWVNDAPPAINATNLNNVEEGVLTNNRLDLSIVVIPPTDADYTLTATENQYGRIEVDTTNWTTARNIIMNNDEHTFLAVVNNTGSQNATFKTSAGAGILVQSGVNLGKQLRNNTVDVIEYEVSTASASISGIRQTVQTSPVDSSGYPNYISIGTGLSVDISATFVNVTIHSSGGKTENDRLGTISSDTSISGLTDATTNYLYADVDASGNVTLGSTILAPVYQFGGTYSTTSGQATFNISEMTMKVGNGASADQVYRVFIGEAVTSGGVVTGVVNYALNGFYSSGRFAISGLTTYNKSCNIGISKEFLEVNLFASNVANGTLYQANYFTLSGTSHGLSYAIQSSNTVSLFTTSNPQVQTSPNTQTTVTEALMNVKRSF